MKGKLVFNLPMEQEEFEAACKGMHYRCLVENIWQEFFRPRHKHGFQDSGINGLLGMDVSEEEWTPSMQACNALMDRLEEIYRQHFTQE